MKCPACGFNIVKIKKDKDRSNPQNRYFHGVVLPLLSETTGYEPEEMKAVVKYKFGIKSTSSLTTAEFEEFMSQVRRWASVELSAWIPEPNESETYE